jgi:4-hydroxybenzoate polyprenyltransferase
MVSNPHSWRLLSTVLLVVFVAGLIAGGPPGWAWVALLLSGVAFAIELLLIRRRDRPPAGP